jgi:hypothetical protein
VYIPNIQSDLEKDVVNANFIFVPFWMVAFGTNFIILVVGNWCVEWPIYLYQNASIWLHPIVDILRRITKMPSHVRLNPCI